MIIKYPNKIAWRKRIMEGENFFKGKKQVRLTKLLGNLDAYTITHRFTVPDEKFFEWFCPEYEKMISAKDNALNINVKNYSIQDDNKPAKRMALEIYNNDILIGATLFFDCRLSANIAFKTYKNKWNIVGPQIGPSLYSEYLIYEWAKEHNKKFVSLGVDRNPYGPNASIGLASYKLSAGYYPKQPKKCVLLEMDTDTIFSDTLIFSTNDTEKKQILKATLITTNPKNYELLLKQSKNIIQIDTLAL